MRQYSDLQKFKDAKTIARDYGLFVVEKSLRTSTAYLLYRRTGTGNAFLGKRGSVDGLYRLVCKVTNFH